MGSTTTMKGPRQMAPVKKKKTPSHKSSPQRGPLASGAATFAASVRRSTHAERVERDLQRAHTASNLNLASIHPGKVAAGLGLLLAGLFLAMYLHNQAIAQVAEAWTYPEQDPESKFTILRPEMPNYLLIITFAVLIIAAIIFSVHNALTRHPRSRLSTIKHEFAAPFAALAITITSLIAYPAFAQEAMSVTKEARTDALVTWIDARYNYNFSPLDVNQLDQLSGNGETKSSATNRVIANGVVITAFREGDQLIILTSDGSRELPPADENAEQAPGVTTENN